MFNTSNTRLAAALKTLGFTLVTWDDDGQHQMMWKFSDNVLFGKNGPDYARLWRDEQWHNFNVNHPFRHIVKVAEARDWIINRVIHGEYQEVGGENQATYFVYDINIAACIIADGYYLLRFADRRFYFLSDAKQLHGDCTAPKHESALWWQCAYLKQLKVLMELVPRQKNILDKGYVSA